jgi:hypothetical protein
LRTGKTLEPVEHRSAKLVQSGEGEFLFGLDPRGGDDVAARRAAYQVTQQRGLPDAGFASQHEGLAFAGTHVGEEAIECRPFGAPV